MRCRFRVAWASLFALLVTIGCQRAVNKAPAGAQGAVSPAAAESMLTIGEPVRYENLTVFPVLASVPRDADRFITLDEGIRDKTVQVTEMGTTIADPFADDPPAEQAAESEQAPDGPSDQGPVQAVAQNETPQLQSVVANNFVFGNSVGCPSVNSVLVTNKSDKPLYLMPGEIIVGGQQDRALAQETIIPPGDKPVEVAVFCVEHGRWADRDADATAALAVDHTDVAGAPVETARLTQLALAKGSNSFLPCPGHLNKRGRMAVQVAHDQSAVWDQVAQTNAASSVESTTGAFTSNYADAEVIKDLRPYVAHLQAPLSDQERIVGVIVAINGAVDSADVFESTPLFRKLWPKLLKGYALDAATRAGEDDATRPVTLASAQKFYDELTNAAVQTTAAGDLLVTNRESPTVVGFSLHEHLDDEDGGVQAAATERSTGAGMMGGGMGGGLGGVHGAGFAK